MLALRLALVAVDGGHANAGRLEMTRDPIGAALGAREHQRARHLRIGEQLHQQRALVVAFDVQHALRDAVDRRSPPERPRP